MPYENTRLLELNLYCKSDKTPFIIYADLETLIENIDGCKNKLEKSFTTYSMSFFNVYNIVI